MKLKITNHLIQRTGNIFPLEDLKSFMKNLIKHNKDITEKDGRYVFENSLNKAVIGVKNNTYTFITLFGKNNHIESLDDFISYQCKFQNEEEYLTRKSLTTPKKIKKPLGNISKENLKRIKLGRFKIIPIQKEFIDIFKVRFGRKPTYTLENVDNGYKLIELLNYDGSKINVIHEKTLENLILKQRTEDERN